MTSASSSDPRSSLRTNVKPNSDIRIYGELEGFYATGDTEAMPSDSARRTRRRFTGKHRDLSLPRLDTSMRSKSSSKAKHNTEMRRRKSTSAIATSTAGALEMPLGISASKRISSPSESCETTMSSRGSSENAMLRSASDMMTKTTVSSEKSKCSPGSSEKKMSRVSSEFITGTDKKLKSSASKIIPSTAGSSQKKKKKKKSSSRSSEQKFSKASSDLITSAGGSSEKTMSTPAPDITTSTGGLSEKKMCMPASDAITSAAGPCEKMMSRAASEIITCADGAFDKTMTRSSSEIITSAAGSSERTKRSSAATDKKKSKSASEKVKSRTSSSEKNKKKKSKSKSIDPLGTSSRSSKRSFPISKEGRLDTTRKERKGRKPTIELDEEPQEMATLTAEEKADEIPVMDANDVGPWFFENASWFKDEVVTEPSTNYMEARRQNKQVLDVSKVSLQQNWKARRNTISHVAIDLLIPTITDTPMSGISMDDLEWEEGLYKKSSLDLGACAPTNDTEKPSLMTVRDKGMDSLVTRLSDGARGDITTGGTSKPFAITANTDVQVRRDLDALRELDRKLTSLLSLETRRRLRQLDKPRPTVDELVIPQGSVTPMSGLSLDGTELLEGHVEESFLNLGASATSFDLDDKCFAIDLGEAPEESYADKQKRSLRSPSPRRSLSCKEGMSIYDENETLRRRRTLKRSESCQETARSKPSATTITDVKDCERFEIPLRDDAGNKVRSRKRNTARREGRNPSSQCLDETRHSRHRGNDKQSKTRHKEKSSKSDQHFYDLHIPRRCDPPLSGISMNDLEWVEDVFSKRILD